MKLKGKPRKARLVGNLLLLASLLLLLLQGTFLNLSDAGMAAVAVLAFALLITALVFLLFWPGAAGNAGAGILPPLRRRHRRRPVIPKENNSPLAVLEVLYIWLT